MDIKTLSKSHVTIQNSLLNDIRRKECTTGKDGSRAHFSGVLR